MLTDFYFFNNGVKRKRVVPVAIKFYKIPEKEQKKKTASNERGKEGLLTQVLGLKTSNRLSA